MNNIFENIKDLGESNILNGFYVTWNDILPILFIIIAFFVARKIYEDKRSNDLKSASRMLGLSFEKKGLIEILEKFQDLQLFSFGYKKRIRNMMSQKSKNAEVMIFEYKFRYKSGIYGSRKTEFHSYSVIAFCSSELDLPNFQLRPETLFDKFSSDIDFDSHPDFSKTYLLKGKDKTAIRRIFSDHVLEYFEKNPVLYVQGRGNILFCYRESEIFKFRLKPKNLRGFLEEGRGIFRLFTED